MIKFTWQIVGINVYLLVQAGQCNSIPEIKDFSMVNFFYMITMVFILSVFVFGKKLETTSDWKQPGDTIVSYEPIINQKNGKRKIVIKNKNGKYVSLSIDKENEVVKEKKGAIEKKSKALKRRLEYNDDIFEILIMLNKRNIPNDRQVSPKKEKLLIESNGNFEIFSNGERINNEEYKKLIKAEKLNRLNRRKMRIHSLDVLTSDFLEDYPFLRQSEKMKSGLISAKINKSQINMLIEDERVSEIGINGIDSTLSVTYQIRDGIEFTRIDPYAYNYTTGGQGIIALVGEAAGCPDNSFTSNYSRLYGTNTDPHSESVIQILRAAAPEVYINCRQSIINTIFNPGNADLINISASNGENNGDYQALDKFADDLAYEDGITIIAAAGNNGDEQGKEWTRTPSNGLNTITVGNFYQFTQAIYYESSWKNPVTSNEKPEIVAPGTNIFLPSYISEPPMIKSGTSLSAPVISGMVACMMDKIPAFVGKPHLVKAALIAASGTIVEEIAGGYDKVGEGSTDFPSTIFDAQSYIYSGPNDAYSTWDSQDQWPNNNSIDDQMYFSSLNHEVKIVIAWLNRGGYTLSAKNNQHPIGMDFDLRVYDPNGNQVGYSGFWDNGYEAVSFNPSVSGNYRIQITRFENRDILSRIELAVWARRYY